MRGWMERLEELVAVAREEARQRILKDRCKVIAEDHRLEKRDAVELGALLEVVADRLFDDDLSIGELEGKGLVNKRTRRSLRQVFGCTMNDYLLRRRFYAAAWLLAHTSFGAPEIATALGYSNYQNFSRDFRRRFGKAPNAFRKGLRESRPKFAETENVNEEVKLGTPIMTVLDFGVAAELVAEAVWAVIREETHPTRLDFLNEIVMESPILEELLIRKSREAGRRDRQQGVELAELAVASTEASRPILGGQFFVRHSFALAWKANAQRLAGSLREVEKTLKKAKRAQAEAVRAGFPNPRTEGFLWLIEGGLRSAQRRFDQAEALLDRAVLRGKSLGDEELEVDARLLRVAVAGYQGHFESMIPDLQIVASLKQALAPRSRLGIHQELSLLYVETGQLELAGFELPIAQALAEELDDTPCRHQLIWIEGMLARERGRLEEAEDFFRCARAGLLELGDHEGVAIVALDLSIVCHRQSRKTEMLRILASDVIPIVNALEIKDEALAAVTLLCADFGAQLPSIDLLQRIRDALLERERERSLKHH